MTDQELRKLKRDELLQIMIAQSKRISVLKKRLDAAEKKLAAKELTMRKAGNIAEASMRLNHIFEAAQASADQYLYNVKRLAAIEIKKMRGASGKHHAEENVEAAFSEILAGIGAEDLLRTGEPDAADQADTDAAETAGQVEDFNTGVEGDPAEYEDEDEIVEASDGVENAEGAAEEEDDGAADDEESSEEETDDHSEDDEDAEDENDDNDEDDSGQDDEDEDEDDDDDDEEEIAGSNDEVAVELL